MDRYDFGFLVGMFLYMIVAAISGPVSWIAFAFSIGVYIPLALITYRKLNEAE